MQLHIHIILLVLGALTWVSAQTVNLTGTVTNCSGGPISGAAVTLASYDVSAVTDEEGVYEIIHTVGVKEVMSSQYGIYALSGRELQLTLNSAVSVSVAFHNLKGKLIRDLHFYTLNDGEHRLPMPKLKEAGLYVMTVSISNTRHTHPVFTSPTGSLILLQNHQSGPGQSINYLAKKSAAPDSLEISASGFMTQVVPVDNLTDTIDVVLLTEDEFTAGDGTCPPAPELKFVVFSVNSADATLVIFPTGKTMMIDSGRDNMCESRIIPFLERHGIDHLDFYTDTHPHDDHDGGRGPLSDAGILNRDTRIWHDENEYVRQYYNNAEDESKDLRYETTFEMEGTSWFISNAVDHDRYGGDANPNSLSYRIEYNGFIYTGSGDEDDEGQDRFLNDHPDLVEAHVRNTAHHMWGPISRDFITATNAYLYIVSNEEDFNGGDMRDLRAGINNIEGNDREHEIAVTGTVGHVIVRASGGGEGQWSYETCKDYSSCVIENFP